MRFKEDETSSEEEDDEPAVVRKGGIRIVTTTTASGEKSMDSEMILNVSRITSFGKCSDFTNKIY